MASPFEGMGLGGLGGGILGESDRTGRSFTDELGVDDFDSFGGSVTSGKDVEVARRRLDADTEARWGYGRAEFDVNQGFLYVDLRDDTAAPGVEMEGTISLWYESSTTRNQKIIKSFKTERLDASKTDKTLMVPLPEQRGKGKVTEDGYMVVKFDPHIATGSGTVDSTNSDVEFPITEYDLTA